VLNVPRGCPDPITEPEFPQEAATQTRALRRNAIRTARRPRRLCAMIEHDAFDFRLNDAETLRDAGQTVDDLFSAFLADRRRLGFARVFRLKDGG
jgi:hypothetical protein